MAFSSPPQTKATKTCQGSLVQTLCLFVKAEKCEFHVTQVSSLGYVISAQGNTMDQDKVSAVTTWPTPTIMKELQCFLDFFQFYKRFVRGFSSIVTPSQPCLKKGRKYQ